MPDSDQAYEPRSSAARQAADVRGPLQEQRGTVRCLTAWRERAPRRRACGKGPLFPAHGEVTRGW